MQTALQERPDLRSLEDGMLLHLTYPQTLRLLVAEMIRAWEAVRALPLAVRKEFGYTQDTEFSGAGLECKDGTESDRKMNFHFRRDKIEFLDAEATRIGLKEFSDLLEACYAVADELEESVLETARFLEEACALPGFARNVALLIESLIIRLLHYPGERKPGDIFGDQHCDKGTMTGHLYESAPGVERLTKQNVWVPMDVKEGKALFFGGLGLQHYSECRLIAPCHRIVATEQTAEFGRVSAVCFVNTGNAWYYDKERLGRTQRFGAGFNYGMPYEDFHKLFKPKGS